MIRRFLWGAFVSFLPQRVRSRSSLEGSRQLVQSATFCGFCQAAVFLFVLIGAFITESMGIWENASNVVLNTESGPTMDPVQVRLTTGTLGVLAFMLQPLHLFYGYMAVEGMIRAFSALSFGHAMGTLPLWLITAVPNFLETRKAKAGLAILSRDVIEPARDGTYDLHVLSHAAKDWSPFIGIQFRGQLYVVDGEQEEAGPRRHGYRLRKNPEGNLMVVVRNYSPNGDRGDMGRAS